MRKLANRILVFLLLSVPMASFAQSSVSGKVLNDKDGSPLEGVSIVVKGKNAGTKTDGNGSFSINAAKGDVIVVTYVNFKPQTIKVKDATSITIRLERADGTMDEVVVTAMDIKRNPRSLGYSVQKVTGQEIVDSRQDNILNSLQGRIAGASITPTGGQAGASSNIVLRGFNSLALSNQPLFIIDGIIVDNSTVDQNSNSGSGLGLASDRPNRNDDYTNRIADLNPNDIASITVLKGPEATALYGSQASAGAIVITTKKSTTSDKMKLSVNYDNNFRTQKLTRLPDIQNIYGPGNNGYYSTPTFTFYGPKYPAGTKFYDNLHDFFQTGLSATQNLSAEWGSKKFALRFSGTYLKNKGVVPTNTYEKINTRLSAYYKPCKYFDITPSISYITSDNDKPLRGANGYLLNLLQWPNDNSIRNYLDASGKKLTLYPQTDPSNELDNPLFNVNYNRSHDVVNRVIATLGVNIYPTKWLTLAGRFGYDKYTNNGWMFFNPQSFYTTVAQKGSLDNYYRVYTGYNHTITATAKKDWRKFEGHLMVGNMWQDYRTDATSVVGYKIVDVNRRDSNNTDPATRARLSRQTLYGQPNYKLQRSVAYFAEAGISYHDLIFVNYTHRFEQSSTLPEKNRSFNYPGASVSMIFSDMFPFLKRSNILSFGKIRGSLAQTARINSPYSNQSVFNVALSSGGGFTYDFTNNNILLEPEKQSTYEIGTELRFFKNKISIDATYYNTLNTKQIIELFRASYGTGFILNTLNLGETRNQGVEISLGINMLKKKDLNWSMNFNFNHMWNKVLSLPANVPEFYISDTWLYGNARGGLVKGGPTTSITSWGYQRNNNGQVLIDPTTGLPLIDQNFRVHGDRNPDFTLGFSNNFRYKNWRFNMLWNGKVGGDVFNGTELFLVQTGRSVRTSDRETPRIFEGVLKDGLENSATPTKNTIQLNPFFRNDALTSVPEEFYIEHNINWLRLSEISISYTIPASKLKGLKVVKGLSLYATGNDLALFTNYSGADPSVNGNTPATRGVGAFGFDYGNIGTPVSFNFGLKASF